VLKFISPSVFIRIVLAISSITPVYIAIYNIFYGDGIARVLFFAISFVCLAHLYYGFKWAKYIVALISIIILVLQFYIFDTTFNGLHPILLIASFIFIVNSVVLIKSKVIAEFLNQKLSNLSDSAALKLKISRWILITIFVIGILMDVMRIIKV
jgi:hypothetical protein